MSGWLMMMGLALVSNANAQEAMVVQSDNNNPTVIFGEAENANGTMNEITVRQAKDAANPFGNPIVNTIPYGKQPVAGNAAQPGGCAAAQQPQPSSVVKPVGAISEITPQDPEISEDSPEQMQNEIENTLYEGDDRIYDVQSYPDDDINQIEGQDSAVTNYPAY